jgi:hypothetical protein
LALIEPKLPGIQRFRGHFAVSAQISRAAWCYRMMTRSPVQDAASADDLPCLPWRASAPGL